MDPLVKKVAERYYTAKIKDRQETFQLEKGLTREQAVKSCPKPKHDHRGFAYDPKTGKVVLT